MIKEGENDFKKIFIGLILIGLIVLLFLILKPILLSILLGIIFAFIFFPIYSWIRKKTKSKNLSAFLICALLVSIIVVPIILLFPYLIEQLVNSYTSFKQIDIITPIKLLFPNILTNDFLLVIIEDTIESTTSNFINSFLNSLTIDNIMSFAFQILVFFFTLFFTLRDNEELNSYIKSLLPFSKEIQNKLYKSSKEITASILYGQVIIGLIQGASLGIGLFIFSVPNAILLTIVAILAGILPIIGTALVWVPVLIYLLVAGNVGAAFGILIFGLFSSSIDNILRPLFLSKKATLSPSLAMIGVIGGWMFFGVLGIILGPLIIAYFLIIVESYRNKNLPGFIIQDKN
jgi:predicted PurR-regulated permease PerM